MKVDQKRFNEDVQTTMVDFDVPVEEAIEMTLEELKIQGYDLTGIDTRAITVLFDPKEAYDFIKQMKQCNSFQSIMSLWDSIRGSPILGSYMPYFIEENVLDAIFKYVTVDDYDRFFDIVSTWCSIYDCEELQSKSYLYSMIQECLSANKNVNPALSLLSQLLSKSDVSRVICSYQKIDNLLIQFLRQSRSIEAMDCLLYLVKDDPFSMETRNSRIRQLLENDDTLCVLVTCLSNELDHKEIVQKTCLLLSKLVIDEPSCKKLNDLNVIPLLSQCLQIHETDWNVLYSILKIFTSLARDDKLKLVLFTAIQSSPSCILKPSSTIKYPKNVIVAILEFVSTVCLRNEEVIASLINDYSYDIHCFHFMKEYPLDRKIQLHGCFLLRSCISKSSECEERLISRGLMDHIQEIMKMDSDLRIACVQLKRSIKCVPFTV